MANTLAFDRNGAETFHRALDEALRGLASTYGIRIKTKTLRFDPTAKTFTVTVEANAGSETDEIIFRKVAPMVGLDPADYGRELAGCTVAGSKIVAVTPKGLLTILTPEGERRHYKARALPALVARLHPGDARKAALARLTVGQSQPGDALLAFPSMEGD